MGQSWQVGTFDLWLVTMEKNVLIKTYKHLLDGNLWNRTSFFIPISDCPQVQCVEKYIAQQPDELTLEESDVINVFKKMGDG